MTVYASHLLLLLYGEHSGRPQESSRWLLPRSGPASQGPEAPSLLVLACRSDLSETHLCHHLRQRPRAPRPAPSQSRMLEKLRAVLSYGPALCVRNLPPPPDVSSFLVFLRYQCYYEYPLLTYLEYPILIVQDVLLLLCAFHFNGNVKGAAPYMAVFVASWFVLPLQKWIIDLAMNLSTFISVASKFAQLQYLWKTRDSGTVSALTWSLAAYTCATRIITTIMTTGDLTILTRFVIMLALNVWVTTTVLRYRKTAVKAE
ncbi:solute carrier family 66 member 3 isoform X2 [Panthera pardus]|uniref:Solute carrier family 66 member 3 isoform X2 n=1 Tax=Panthera pardus TaxID=9691 RepID=A0A9V1FR35_PANPR|nr:solute carrier family 66 member 3 isoform X2 [Panthera pardus]